MEKIIQFNEWKCYLVKKSYKSNNNICLKLYDCEDNQPVITCTSNFEGKNMLSKDEVAIKNYAENEGILECLIENEIISKPKYYYNNCAVCTLIYKFDEKDN